MQLKNKPLYNQEGGEEQALKRIILYCQPKDFNISSTVFHMGFEQAKRDILRIIEKELSNEGSRSDGL